jgi:formiminotetrahydrofolate cyclodeaminase
MIEYFVMILCGAVGGGLLHTVLNWTMHREIYSLQCDVADLKDKVLVEIKKRASLTHRAKKEDDETLDKIVEAAKTSPAPALPWWARPSPVNEKAV